MPNCHMIVRATAEPILPAAYLLHMLSANRWIRSFLNMALGCLVVIIAIEVAIEAVAKRLKPNSTRIEIKAAQSPPATLPTK
jgi:hypothetical protein